MHQWVRTQPMYTYNIQGSPRKGGEKKERKKMKQLSSTATILNHLEKLRAIAFPTNLDPESKPARFI